MEGFEEWLNQNNQVSENQRNINKLPVDVETTNYNDKSVNSDRKKGCHEIIRNFHDDWSYHYIGNPHNRYLTILQEERNLDKRTKKERSKDDDNCSHRSRNRNRSRYDEEYLESSKETEYSWRKRKFSHERDNDHKTNESYKSHRKRNEKHYEKSDKEYKEYHDEIKKRHDRFDTNRKRGYKDEIYERKYDIKYRHDEKFHYYKYYKKEKSKNDRNYSESSYRRRSHSRESYASYYEEKSRKDRKELVSFVDCQQSSSDLGSTYDYNCSKKHNKSKEHNHGRKHKKRKKKEYSETSDSDSIVKESD